MCFCFHWSVLDSNTALSHWQPYFTPYSVQFPDISIIKHWLWITYLIKRLTLLGKSTFCRALRQKTLLPGSFTWHHNLQITFVMFGHIILHLRYYCQQHSSARCTSILSSCTCYLLRHCISIWNHVPILNIVKSPSLWSSSICVGANILHSPI